MAYKLLSFNIWENVAGSELVPSLLGNGFLKGFHKSQKIINET